MKAYMFPGQGSQRVGMGRDLFDSVDEFKRNEQEIDHIVGCSVRELCSKDPDRLLSKTQFTQPALYIVNSLTYFRHMDHNGGPDFLIGHSLGEATALMAAGAFDFMTGLRITKTRGELMSKANGGGMAAVIGLAAEKISRVLAAEGLKSVHIANYNSGSQVVISGDRAELLASQKGLEREGAEAVVPLAVSAAFHSPFMDEAAGAFRRFLDGIEISKLRVPVISNFMADMYPADDPLRLRDLLTMQITGPVKWHQSIELLLERGVTSFEELGPGTVLAKLVDQIRRTFVPAQDQDVVRRVAPPASAAALVSGTSETLVADAISPGPRVVTSDRLPASAPPVRADLLGSAEFRRDYKVRYAYVAGAMYKGIASRELVEAMAARSMLSFLGTGGMSIDEIEQAIRYLQERLPADAPYGMNLLCDLVDPASEIRTVELYLRYGIKNVEAAAFTQVTDSLVLFRAAGLGRGADGSVTINHRVMAKVSRPETAAMFLDAAPSSHIRRLLAAGRISPMQAELAAAVPLADDICVEADSGGHTDQGVAFALLPAIQLLRDEALNARPNGRRVRVGAAGGIGTPAAAAAAFVMGADFIVTGSINQCTVEAGTSDAAKDLLQDAGVQDTTYAPAGDMFEMGSKVQVLRKGLFFAARANKLFEIYSRSTSVDDIDQATKRQIEDKYFRRSFEEVWAETRSYLLAKGSINVDEIERNPKRKMAHIFRWYFAHTTKLAMKGSQDQQLDYQIHCGPALGSFNQWVRGTSLESWRNRRTGEIAELIMSGTADLLTQRMRGMIA